MSESVDASLWTKNCVKIYNKKETKLTIIPYSFFFFFFLSSKCVKIARLAIFENFKISAYIQIHVKIIP